MKQKNMIWIYRRIKFGLKNKIYLFIMLQRKTIKNWSFEINNISNKLEFILREFTKKNPDEG